MALATRAQGSKAKQTMMVLTDAGANGQTLALARDLLAAGVDPSVVLNTALSGLSSLIRLHSSVMMQQEPAEPEVVETPFMDWRREMRGGRVMGVRPPMQYEEPAPPQDFGRLLNYHVDRVRKEMRQEFRGHLQRARQETRQMLVKTDSINERGTPSGFGVLQMLLDTSPAAAGASPGSLANLPYALYGVALLLEDGGIVSTVDSVIVDGVTQTLGPNTTARIPGSILDAGTFHRNAIWAGDIKTSLTVNATVTGAGRWWVYTVAQPGISLNPTRISPCCPPGRPGRRADFRTPDLDGPDEGYEGYEGYDLPEPIYRG